MNASRSRRVSLLAALLVSLFSLLLMHGCGERTLDVEVTLVTQSCPDRDGQVMDALASVHFLKFVVSGDGLATPLETIASVGEGRATIPGIPLAGTSGGGEVRRRIDVYARSTNPENGPILARGAVVFDVDGEARSLRVPIFLRPRDSFGFTAAADAVSTCTTMNRSRSGHTATVLRDGRVLIVGGAIVEGEERIVHASAEIFDPSTGRFVLLEGDAGPRQPRVFHTATLLRDGRVLVAGGEYDPPGGGGTQANKSAEIFDPTTDTFLAPIVLPRARTRHTATSVTGDMVLLAGGYTDPNPPPGKTHPVPTQTTDIFFGANGTASFKEGVDLQAPRAEHCAVTTAAGTRVVLAGGKTVSGSDVATDGTLRYLAAWPPDGATEGRFTLVGADPYAMRTGRYGLGCGVIRNASGGEQIVMAGGFRSISSLGDDSAFAGVEAFDPSATIPGYEMGSLAGGARGDLCAVKVDEDLIFIGGYRGDAPAASIAVDRLRREEIGPVLQAVQGRMHDNRYFHQCTVLRDGSVLVTGGQYDEAVQPGEPLSLSSAEIFTPLRTE